MSAVIADSTIQSLRCDWLIWTYLGV